MRGDWIETEVGFIRPSEVAAVFIAERSSSFWNERKGYVDGAEWNVLVVVTRGGAEIVVRDDRFSAADLPACRRLVEEIESVLSPLVVEAQRIEDEGRGSDAS